MKRNMMFLVGVAVLLAVTVASATKWQSYCFTNTAAPKIASVFSSQNPPPIEVDQTLTEADTTIYMARGNHSNLSIVGTPSQKEVVSFDRNINLYGEVEIRHAIFLVPVDGWIGVKPGANAVLEDVQILGVGPEALDPRDGLANNSGGLSVNNEANVTAVDLIIAGHEDGLFISTGDFDPFRHGATFEGDNVYTTNNRYGVVVLGYYGAIVLESAEVADVIGNVTLRNSASWDNIAYSLCIGDYRFDGVMFIWPASMNLIVTDSWIQGKITFSGLNEFSSVVFNRTSLPESFIPSLHQYRASSYSEGANLVQVFENRPFGVAQVWPRNIPLALTDFTGNGEIGLSDILYLATDFGAQIDEVQFGYLYDLDKSLVVDWPDLEAVTRGYLGIPEDVALSEVAGNPEMVASLEQKGIALLEALTQYPAVKDALMNDPGFGILMRAFIQTAVAEVGGEVPSEFALSQNYPNPFNPETFIRFSLPEEAKVELTVYNVSGQVVACLVDEWLPAGSYIQLWDGIGADSRPVGSGTYFYRMSAGEYTQVNKMTLLR